MHSTTAKRLLLSLFVTSVFAAPTLADNNSALIRQESLIGSVLGNTLSIDQSGATNASFGGIDARLAGPTSAAALALLSGQLGSPRLAIQRGENNSANATMTGVGGELQFFQSTASRNGSGGDNQASLVAANAALGGIIQIGEFNRATLDVTDGRGLVTQLGDRNNANLNVSDLASRGTLSQSGNRNTGSLEVGSGGDGTLLQLGNGNSGQVEVGNGATVVYTQIGGVQSTSPLSVMSNANGPVIVTQTAF